MIKSRANCQLSNQSAAPSIDVPQENQEKTKTKFGGNKIN